MGDRLNPEDAYKHALEFDVRVRTKHATRESYLATLSDAQRKDAEYIFAEVDRGIDNEGVVSNPELLVHRVSHMLASFKRVDSQAGSGGFGMIVLLAIGCFIAYQCGTHSGSEGRRSSCAVVAPLGAAEAQVPARVRAEP